MPLSLSPAGRRYGRLKLPPDHRDRTLRGTPMERLTAFPSKVDLRQFCGPIKDQGQLGSCTAHAWTSLLEYLYRKYKNEQPVFSPQFFYYEERLHEGDPNDDGGANSRTGGWVLTHVGVCLVSQDPYDVSTFTQAPTDQQVQEALPYKGGAYHALHTLLDIKACLSEGFAHTIGFDVYESFESDQVAKTGLMPIPNKQTEQLLGGHEVLAVGYDDSIQCPLAPNPGALIVQNSWGTSWGAQGFFFMPYDFITDPTCDSDYFMYHLGLPWK